MVRLSAAATAFLLVSACGGDEEDPTSEPVENPSFEFEIPPPDVDTATPVFTDTSVDDTDITATTGGTGMTATGGTGMMATGGTGMMATGGTGMMDTGSTGTGDTGAAPVMYDFQLDGSGFPTPASDGVVVYAVVIRNVDTTPVAMDNTPLAGGTFTLSFPGVLEDGLAYTVDYFVDGIASGGTCTYAPPNEVSWRIAVPAASANVAEVMNPTTTPDAAACNSFP